MGKGLALLLGGLLVCTIGGGVNYISATSGGMHVVNMGAPFFIAGAGLVGLAIREWRKSRQ